MSVQLRPLGIGEIFDHAVTLYVRNFRTFTIVAAIVTVPLTLAQYFVTAHTGSLAQILQQIQHPGKAGAPPAFTGWFLLDLALTVLLTPFMYVAAASALGRIYEGKPAGWRDAYRVALRHSAGIVATVLCEVALVLFAAFFGGLIVGVAVGFSAAVARAAAAVGMVMLVVALLLALVYVLGLMLMYLAVAMAFDAIGIEELPFARAISSGFARIFNRREAGKAILICLAFAALQIALMIVAFATGALIGGVVRNPAIETLIGGVLSLISGAFMSVLIAVYYFDVRVRREALDLEAEIDALQPAAQS